MSDLDSNVEFDGCAEPMKTLSSGFKHMNLDTERADSGFGNSINTNDEEDLAIRLKGQSIHMDQPYTTRNTSLSAVSSEGESKTKFVDNQEDIADEGFYSESIKDEMREHYLLEETSPTRQYKEALEAYSPDEDGDTNLHMAIIQLRWDVSTSMIKIAPNSSYLNLVNNMLQTPLHLAVLTRQPNIVRRLITAGAQVDGRDLNGNTPLHIACREGFNDIVDLLMRPVFHEETLENSYDIPFQIIPQDLEAKNYEGLTCLHLAAQGSHKSVIDLLLERGANINAQDGKSGRTVLHYAAEMGDISLLCYLLSQPKVNVNCKTYSGMTPISLAAGRNHREIVSELSSFGADWCPIQDETDSDDEMNDDMLYDDICISGRPVPIW